jgi:hypothetical protein
MIALVRSGVLSEKELISLSEKNSTAVNAEIENKMRDQFPRAANRRFGKPRDDAYEILSGTQQEILAEFDLSKCTLKGTHVKLGGDPREGTKYTQWFVAYKPSRTEGAQLVLEQETRESELVACIKRYHPGDGWKTERTFLMSDYADAVTQYKQRLRALGAGPRNPGPA